MGIKNSDGAVPGAKSSLWKQELREHVDGTQAPLQARGRTILFSFYLQTLNTLLSNTDYTTEAPLGAEVTETLL